MQTLAIDLTQVNQFLVQIHVLSRGDEMFWVSLSDVGKKLGVDLETSERITERLVGTGLIQCPELGGTIAITHRGVVAAELLLGASDRTARARFLKRLFKRSGESADPWFLAGDIGSEIGIDHETTERVRQYLLGEGLIENFTVQGHVGITRRGIAAVKRGPAG